MEWEKNAILYKLLATYICTVVHLFLNTKSCMLIECLLNKFIVSDTLIYMITSTHSSLNLINIKNGNYNNSVYPMAQFTIRKKPQDM